MFDYQDIASVKEYWKTREQYRELFILVAFVVGILLGTLIK